MVEKELKSVSATAGHRRAAIEALENRLLMHSGSVHDFDPGYAHPIVPWAVAPIVAIPAGDDGGGSTDGGTSTGDTSGTDTSGGAISGGESAALTAGTNFRIEVGGNGYTDSAGKSWLSDRYYTGGTISSGVYDVAGTSDDTLYSTRRWGAFNYSIPVTNGSYSLKLYFADPLYTTAGKRKFNVKAEGGTILSNFDIAASGGGKHSLTKSSTVNVTDGRLDLAFAKIVENPILSAIEITPASSPAPSPPPAPTPTPTPTTDFTQITWTTKASSPIARAEALKAVVDGKIYVFGGFSDAAGPVTRSDVYDPATDTWTRIADLPERITHAGVTVVGHDVYIAGGYIGKPGRTGYDQTFGSKNVWKYNIDSKTYTAATALPQALAGGGLVAVGRELHYFGGFKLDRSDTTLHLVLNLDNLSAGWKTSTPMPEARNHLAYVNYNGKIFAIAGQTGYDDGLTTHSEVFIFDPATAAWTRGASMKVAESHVSSATFVMGDRIIVSGGETAHEHPTGNVFAYSPASNSWVTLTSLPAPRFSGVAAAIDGVIYFTTGNSSVTYKGTPKV